MTWRPVDDDELKPLENELLWEHLAEKAANSDGQTMLYCRYISKTYYQHVIGIPLAPFRHNFNKPGELKCFTLLFPKVPKYWKSFHLVERAGAGSFRVRDIHRNDSGIYIVQLM